MTPQAIVLALTCAAFVLHVQTPSQPPNALPAAIRAKLTGAFPGWRIAELTANIEPAWRRAFPEATPNVVRGDYDGDGRHDFTVLIEYTRGGSPTQPRRVNRAIAFLHRPSGFRMFTLTEEVEFNADDGLYLWPIAKGEKSRDLNTPDVEFTYERDAVGVLYDSKGPCTAFIYRKGSFRSVWTCD